MILREGIIRKISIGEDIKNSMVYEVGRDVNRNLFTITKISFSDIESFMYDSIIINIICRKKTGSDTAFVWKSIIDFKNLSIEYENE